MTHQRYYNESIFVQYCRYYDQNIKYYDTGTESTMHAVRLMILLLQSYVNIILAQIFNRQILFHLSILSNITKN